MFKTITKVFILVFEETIKEVKKNLNKTVAHGSSDT